jgi:hypothetical protein
MNDDDDDVDVDHRADPGDPLSSTDLSGILIPPREPTSTS